MRIFASVFLLFFVNHARGSEYVDILLSKMDKRRQDMKIMFDNALDGGEDVLSIPERLMWGELLERLLHCGSSQGPKWLSAYSPLTLLYIQEQAELSLAKSQARELAAAILEQERILTFMERKVEKIPTYSAVHDRLYHVKEIRRELKHLSHSTQTDRMGLRRFKLYVDALLNIIFPSSVNLKMHTTEIITMNLQVDEFLRAFFEENGSHYHAAYGIFSSAHGELLRFYEIPAHTQDARPVDNLRYGLSTMKAYLDKLNALIATKTAAIKCSEPRPLVLKSTGHP